jgi:serine/threonine-protein kinase
MEPAPPAPTPLAAAEAPAPTSLAAAEERTPAEQPEPPATPASEPPEATAKPAPAASARSAPIRARSASPRPGDSSPTAAAMLPAPAERAPEPALIKPEPVPEARPEQALSKPATLPTQYRAASGPTGLVMLAISPWGEVLVDGKMVGVSPPMNELELAPGKHHIEVRNGMFKPYRTEVDLGPNETTRIKHKFLQGR